MCTIGARLREERERLSMNQTDFAKIGGVQKRAQVNYESGERYPDASYLAAVAEAKVDVLYVLTGKRLSTPAPAVTSYGQATVTALPANESGLLTQQQILEIVLDAMYQAGKVLPAKAVNALVETGMRLQRVGLPVTKSAVDAQLRGVK